MKITLLTNIPAPYREAVHELVAKQLGSNYEVIYCSLIENDRKWRFTLGEYPKVFLKGKNVNINSKTVYLQSNILSILQRKSPDIIIISGFSIPYLLAFIWAKWHRKKIVFFSDATVCSESHLSFLHRILRKTIYKNCAAFIGASKKTLQLFQSYGAAESKLFQSHLCANNPAFYKEIKSFEQRSFDVILSGKMIEGKMLNFSLNVISEVKKTHPNIKIILLGDGPLKDIIIERLNRLGIDFIYPGFVQQHELVKYYTNAKVLLFPSIRDAWGVVANEACASGTPVITCDKVGAANELIIHNINGYVLPTDVTLWAKSLKQLINNEKIWSTMSKECLTLVKQYNYANAATGIVKAINFTKVNK